MCLTNTNGTALTHIHMRIWNIPDMCKHGVLLSTQWIRTYSVTSEPAHDSKSSFLLRADLEYINNNIFAGFTCTEINMTSETSHHVTLGLNSCRNWVNIKIRKGAHRYTHTYSQTDTPRLSNYYFKNAKNYNM